MPAMSRIIVADDHNLYRRGLRTVLESAIKDLEVVEVETVDALLGALEDPVVVALIDVDMAGIGEVNVLRDLRRSFALTRFVILSASDSLSIVLDGLAAGLHGFISKTQKDDEIVGAVLDVLSGRVYVPPSIVRPPSDGPGSMPAPLAGRVPRRLDTLRLTTRQLEVLTLVAEGLSNKEIARRLEIAEPTTKIHVAALMRALDVRNRTEAAVLAKTWLDRAGNGSK